MFQVPPTPTVPHTVKVSLSTSGVVGVQLVIIVATGQGPSPPPLFHTQTRAQALSILVLSLLLLCLFRSALRLARACPARLPVWVTRTPCSVLRAPYHRPGPAPTQYTLLSRPLTILCCHVSLPPCPPHTGLLWPFQNFRPSGLTPSTLLQPATYLPRLADRGP